MTRNRDATAAIRILTQIITEKQREREELMKRMAYLRVQMASVGERDFTNGGKSSCSQCDALQKENDRLLDAWMQDETIGITGGRDDGSLRPSIRKTVERAERAEARIVELQQEIGGKRP